MNDTRKWKITKDGAEWDIERLNYDSMELYYVGIERTTSTYCIWFSVWNGMAEYMEYYWVEDDEFAVYEKDHAALTAFVNRCKRREMDERLMFHPGTRRGWAI